MPDAVGFFIGGTRCYRTLPMTTEVNKSDWSCAASCHTWSWSFCSFFSTAAFKFVDLIPLFMISNKEQFGRKDGKDNNDDKDDHHEALSQSPTTLVWDQENWIGRSGSRGNVVISMQIQGDSLSCTQWLNGLWFPQKCPHAKM